MTKATNSMLDDLRSLLPPPGFEDVTDVNERVQAGDMIYDTDDLEWYEPSRGQVGKYVSSFTAVVRKAPAKAKRILRSRRT